MAKPDIPGKPNKPDPKSGSSHSALSVHDRVSHHEFRGYKKTREGISVDDEGVPHHGPLADHVNRARKQAHDNYMEELRNGRWPIAEDYKRAMREAKDSALASWGMALDTTPKS